MSDIKDTNPKDDVATSRLDLSLFPASARAYGALAFVEGDQKYGGYNWRVVGVRSSVYYAACGRHLDKWFNGEDEDPVTNVPHMASALACLAILIDAIEQKNLNDDRPPRQSGELYVRMERTVKHLQTIFPRSVSRYQTSLREPTPDRLASLIAKVDLTDYEVPHVPTREEIADVFRPADPPPFLVELRGKVVEMPHPDAVVARAERIPCATAIHYGLEWRAKCYECNPIREQQVSGA